MKPIDVEMISKKLAAFVAERDWDQFHSPKNLAMALSVEASELVEIFQWMTEDQSRKISQDETRRQQLADEIADVFVYLLRIASKADIDIHDATLAKLVKNAKKYPVEKAKGSAKKYTEL